MKKRILAIVLCLVMVLTMGAGNLAFATENASDDIVIAELTENEDLVGTTVTISEGVYVYESADENSDSYKVWALFGAYEFLLEEQVVDDVGNVWYRYSCDNGTANTFASRYPYIKASDLPKNEEEPDDEIMADETVAFEGSVNDASVEIFASQGVFPEGTIMQVKETSVDEVAVEKAVESFSGNMEVLGMYPIDISFYLDGKNQQPKESVALNIELPRSTIPSDANTVVVVHLGESGPEILKSKYLISAADSQGVTVRASSFSTYVAVYVNQKYKSKLMREVLAGNNTYSIKTFKVDLIDYVASTFNAAESGNNFEFRGTGSNATDTGASGINDSGQYAKQGILENTLNDSGYPEIRFSDNVSGEDVFSTSTYAGKTVNDDIDFEFIYNKNTGYYEYKSAANHAQYNAGTNKVELYADTLSPANNNRSKLDLDSYASLTQLSEKSGSDTSLSVTTTDPDSAGRLDPYIIYTGLNIDAANVDQIYIKAKIPAAVKANKFQIFYSEENATNKFSEGKSIMVDYTPNGEWAEFVFDTKDLTGTIKAFRIDPFDTNKGSLDTSKNYTVEISEVAFLKDVDEHYTRGGFYPFSNIENSFPGNGDKFAYETWATLHESGKITNVSSRAVVNGASANVMPTEQLHYGVVMDFDFYLPVSGTASGDENDTTTIDDNLRFEFTGDDDLWVFVDGKLALDIGGGHGATYGYIDFTDGTAYVESAVTVTGYNSVAETKKDANGQTVADPKPKSISIKEYVVSEDATTGEKTVVDLTTPGKHTIKMFYLERCATVSNCFIKFNLPQTPEAPVVVTKTVEEMVDGYTPEKEDPIYNKMYDFEITVGGVHPTNDPNTEKDEMEYIVFGEGITSPEGVTKQLSSDGKFQLKHGQSATFNIDENKDVVVKELGTEQDMAIDNYEYVGTTANGKKSYQASGKTKANSSLTFDFVNRYEALGDLTVTKAGILPVDHDNTNVPGDREQQSTVFTVSGPNGYSQDVAILGNGSVTIKNLPLGDYTVTEKDSWIWRYNPINSDNNIELSQSVDLKHTRVATTTFNNLRNERYWLNGGAYCKNTFGKIRENANN